MDAQNRVLIPPESYWPNGINCHLQPTLDPKLINGKCAVIAWTELSYEKLQYSNQ